MKELVPMNEYGVFADTKDTARVDSRYVAEIFGKQHGHVLRDIEKITQSNSGLSEAFVQSNFGLISYRDNYERKQKAYAMTRDGFTMLVMGYTGKKAMRFKEAYIQQFNRMESFIKNLTTARQDFPLLTANIKLIHDKPMPYHFSNECDMINRLVTGMTAKQFRQAHDIPKGESIRPYLTQPQIDLLEALQRADIGLLIAFPDYETRKRHLEWYKQQVLGVKEISA